MSFMRFLELTIADAIQDSHTLWDFHEQLILIQTFNQILSNISQALLMVFTSIKTTERLPFCSRSLHTRGLRAMYCNSRPNSSDW